MKIVRTEWVRETREYILDIDKQYCDWMTEQINKRLVEGEAPITVTEDLIRKVLYNDEELDDVKIKMTSTWNENGFYEEYLADYIREYINEDLWDSDYDTINCETDDSEDEIID